MMIRTRPEVVVATGAANANFIGLRYPKRDSIAAGNAGGSGVSVEAVDQRPETTAPASVRPGESGDGPSTRGETGPRGAIVAGRIIPHAPFTDADPTWRRLSQVRRPSPWSFSDARADQQRLGVSRIGTALRATCTTT